MIAALKRGTIIDRGLVGLSLVLYAFPTFFIGLLLYKFVAIQWGWVDVPRYTTIAEGGVTGWLSSLLLPGITLAVFFMAAYVRMTRAYVLESLSRGLRPHRAGQGTAQADGDLQARPARRADPAS